MTCSCRSGGPPPLQLAAQLPRHPWGWRFPPLPDPAPAPSYAAQAQGQHRDKESGQ